MTPVASPGTDQRTDVVLEMQDVTKDFPGVRALKGVSLSVRAGEVHALLGENGAGKSTLMNVLAGVFSDYGGRIAIAGERTDIHTPSAAERLGIAMIHQELNLVPELSVAENVFLGREPRTRFGTVDRRTMVRESRRLLAELGLHLDPNRAVRHFRVGEQQLIEVAKALTFDVRVLVMDEPTSALADAEVENLFSVIRGLQRRGVAIVYISHRLEELYEIADTVTVLRDGQYIGSEPMKETAREALIEMMVGRPLQDLYPRGSQLTRESDIRLKVRGLSVAGDRLESKAALHGVDLDLRAGEIVGVAGLMGAGRTELLEALYGAYGAGRVRGSIMVDGKTYRPSSPSHAIAAGVVLVPEDRKGQGLVLENTVSFNASLSILRSLRRLLVINRRRERELVRAQARSLRIKTPALDTVVQTLSGGNQQKVVLARCLLTRPKVVLLDEPTRGIDVGAKAEIYALMSELVSQGAAILMVSSELPELLAMCDRIVVLCEGRQTGEFPAAGTSQEQILDAAMARQAVVSRVGHDNSDPHDGSQR